MVEREGHEHCVMANLLFLKDEEPEEILFHAKLAIELGLSTSEEALMRQLVGSLYFRQENFSEAEAEIKKALELDEKSDEKLNALHYSTSCQELAQIYEKRGDIPQAIKCSEDAIIHLQTQYDPDKNKAAIGMVFNGLAAVYMAQYLSNPNELTSADEQCFQSLQRSLEINPYYYETYLYLGIVHGGKEFAKYYDPQKAIGYYEQALTRMGPLDSDDSEERAKREMAQENIELLNVAKEMPEDYEEKKKKEGEGCFIATAAYGTPYAVELQILRVFRDDHLLKNSFGRLFVNVYYQVSPAVASFIEKHEIAKSLTKAILIKPILLIIKNLGVYRR